MSHIFNAALRNSLTTRLGAFERLPTTQSELKRAAVAITIIPTEATAGETTAGFLLTRRAPKLNAHAGQWALPGGRLDAGETVIDAALRELEEEVSLTPSASNVLGMLDDYPTRSGYLITPVIVWAETTSGMKPNPGEVASIHPFALSELERQDSPIFLTIPESEKPVIRLLLGETGHIHAPTAAMLYQFAEVALRGHPTRVTDFEQPVWAWK